MARHQRAHAPRLASDETIVWRGELAPRPWSFHGSGFEAPPHLCLAVPQALGHTDGR